MLKEIAAGKFKGLKCEILFVSKDLTKAYVSIITARGFSVWIDTGDIIH